MPNVWVEGHSIPYTIIHKPIRKIHLHVTKQGQVYISAPKHMPRAQLVGMVEQRKDWIFAHWQKAQQRLAMQTDLLTTLRLWGTRYPVQRQQGQPAGMKLQGDTCYLILPKNATEQSSIRTVQKLLAKELLEKAQEVWPAIGERFSAYALPPIALKARKMKGSWGLCHPTRREIIINTALVHAPVCCLAYLLAHEAAHFVVQNHSKAFYRVLESAYPMAKEHKKLLKEQNL